MDLLTDILNTSGLKRRLLHKITLDKPWAITFPCPKSIGFHVVTQGKAYLWKSGEKTPVILKCGDIAFAARGTNHHISTHNDYKLVSEAISIDIENKKKANHKQAILTIVSGAYQLWHDPIHPMFNDLPEWFIIKSESITYSDSLQNCMQLLSSELEQPDLGSETIINSILDIMFNLILRRSLYTENKKNWGSALYNPYINKAVQIMHQNYHDNWTVESLANYVGLSRSGFALKFKKEMGISPLQYLTNLRILKAMDILANTDKKLESVSNLVGYKDAFSFSKAFKKIVSLSPKDFRNKNNSEQRLDLRFY